MKDVRNIMAEMRANPEALAMLKDRAKPENQEEEIRVYAETARKLGYDVTDGDIRQYLSEITAALSQRTNLSADSIRELPPSELVEAAGGGDHKECYDTYRNQENCWWTDGCDRVHEKYHGYQCSSSNKCDNSATSCGDPNRNFLPYI